MIWSFLMGMVSPQLFVTAIVLLVLCGLLSVTKWTPSFRLRLAAVAVGFIIVSGPLVELFALNPAIAIPPSLTPGPPNMVARQELSHTAFALTDQYKQEGMPFIEASNKAWKDAKYKVAYGMSWNWVSVPIMFIFLFPFAIYQSIINTRLLKMSRPASERIKSLLSDLQPQHSYVEIEAKLNDSLAVPAALVGPNTVLLPSDAESWSDQKLRAVLAHEAAHIREKHVMTIGFVRFVTILTVIAPWGFWAVRKLKVLAELAADDAAIAMNVKPTDLSEALLSFAGKRSLRPIGGLRLAEGGDVKSRIRRIIENKPPKRTNLMLANIIGALVTLLATFCIASNKAAFNRPVSENYGSPGITVVSPYNNFASIDSQGKKVKVVGMTMKRNGKLMDWTSDKGWAPSNEQVGIMGNFFDRRGVTIDFEIEDWPSLENDRAYSLSDLWVVTWDNKITVYKENGKDLTTLVYSLNEWKDVGTYYSESSKLGRIKEFDNVRLGRAQLSDMDRPFAVNYTQKAGMGSDITEFGYDWKVIDRGLTDRMVYFYLKNGERVETEQIMVEGSKLRETWRAEVAPDQVVRVVMLERPTFKIEVEGLPIK
ncbi:MAG: M48 family metalloprotease [Fimbriimonadaceae bacterium]|nr:M48 family metalloprotease [Fimbriimonadaceae bacterium]